MRTIFALTLLCCFIPTAQAVQPAAAAKKGSWTEIKEAVEARLEAIDGYRAGDLICKTQATAVLQQLASIGFRPADAETILARVPNDTEFLVVRLHSKAGRSFMRKVSRYPQAYDRLDRLSRLAHGQRTIDDMIRGPGGEKLIEYMTTTPGGKALGGQLSQGPGGADFNKPTGRIYTGGDLLDALEQSYRAQQAKPASASASDGRS